MDEKTWVSAIDYLRPTRKLYQVQNELNQILTLDYATREKLLDALTDIVSVDIYEEDIEEIEKRLEGKLSELKEFDETFKKLKMFTTRLDSHQRSEVYKLTLRKLNGRVTSIRDEIKSKIWDINEDSRQLLVLDQIFFLIQELIKDAIKKVDDFDLWIMISISLLRIEAFHRGKITFEDLQHDVSELSLFNLKEETIPKNYNAVFEVLEA